ncbi:hypothetical protein [Aquimarina sp. SS2-1]|uniref:hypothetical protein n=1 Tax=Aquimarina besae TaxID=3342247 RepID=UPI00366C46FB
MRPKSLDDDADVHINLTDVIPMKKKLNLTVVAIVLLLGFQVLQAQRTIGPPALTENPQQTCGKPGVTFEFEAQLRAGPALPSNNEFLLELSDPSGSFANQSDIIELGRILGPNEAAGGATTILFTGVEVPTNANSDDYRVRVIATEADIIGQVSEPIPFHFFDDDNLLIRLNGGRGVIFCDVASFAKEIGVVVLDENDDPLDPNDFNWEWTKDGIVIPGENSPTLLITEEGQYQAVVPVGLCNNTFRFNKSNIIRAEIVNTGDISIVTDAPDFSFCPEEVKVLRASEEDQRRRHQWYKDGVPLEGEISTRITLPNNNFGGEYTLEIVLSEDCTFTTDPVTVTNEGSNITVPFPEELIFLPNQVLTLTLETDAPLGSQYRFLVNGNVLTQSQLTEQTLTFDSITSLGEYRVEIEADDPCNTFLVTETEIFSTEIFEIVIAPEEVVDCDQDVITISLLEMVGIIGGNRRVPLTDEQLGLFDFEWFQDGVSTGETSLSFDVSRADNGGIFELRASYRPAGLPDQTSNQLPIDFLSNNIILDITPPVLEAGESVVLTAPFSDNFTYEWYVIQNGQEALIEGEATNILTVTEEGDYFARISSSLCTTDTLIASVRGPGAQSEVIPNVITQGRGSSSDVWVLPNSFSESGVEVSIYSSNGKLDFQKSGGYNADWPSNSASGADELIYYYIIKRNSEVVRKGTITVMR